MTFASAVSPQLHRALAWRQKLGELFALVEVVLTLNAPIMPTAKELANAVAAFTGREFQREQLAQLLAIATGMLWTHKLAGGVLAVSQHADASELKKLPVDMLMTRCERFEAAAAALTEDLACNRLPRRELPDSEPKGGRRLSRQTCIMVPKGVPMQELGERTKCHQQAVAAKKQSERWLRIAQGAESARRILEQLIAKSGHVSLDRVLRALTSRRSSLRQGQALPADEAHAALMLLASRAPGGLNIDKNQGCQQQIRFYFRPVEGVAVKAAQRSLDRDFTSLQCRHQQYCADAKRAFIATYLGCIEP